MAFRKESSISPTTYPFPELEPDNPNDGGQESSSRPAWAAPRANLNLFLQHAAESSSYQNRFGYDGPSPLAPNSQHGGVDLRGSTPTFVSPMPMKSTYVPGAYTPAGSNYGPRMYTPSPISPAQSSRYNTPESATSTGHRIDAAPASSRQFAYQDHLRGMRPIPTAPRAMIEQQAQYAQYHQMMQQEPVPVPGSRRNDNYIDRINKTRKDVIITSQGVIYNAVRMINGQPTNEFLLTNQDLLPAVQNISEQDLKEFWSGSYVEIIVDISAVEAEAEGRLVELSAQPTARAAKASSSQAGPAGSPGFNGVRKDVVGMTRELDESFLNMRLDNQRSNGNSSSGTALPTNISAGPSGSSAVYGRFGGREGGEQGYTGMGRHISQVPLDVFPGPSDDHPRPMMANLASDLFEVIDQLGPAFLEYARHIFVSLRFSAAPAQLPTRRPHIADFWGHERDLCSRRLGAIDTDSTPAFRYISRVVDTLENFTSIRRLDVTLEVPRDQPHSFSKEQLEHILPFYNLECCTKWRVWWRVHDFTFPDQVDNKSWPIDHMNVEWGKLWSQMHLEHNSVCLHHLR